MATKKKTEKEENKNQRSSLNSTVITSLLFVIAIDDFFCVPFFSSFPFVLIFQILTSESNKEKKVRKHIKFQFHLVHFVIHKFIFLFIWYLSLYGKLDRQFRISNAQYSFSYSKLNKFFIYFMKSMVENVFIFESECRQRINELKAVKRDYLSDIHKYSLLIKCVD